MTLYEERKQRERKSSRASKILWPLLFVLSIFLIGAVIAMAVESRLPAEPETEVKKRPSIPDIATTEQPKDPNEMLPEMKELYEQNSDIVGWIKMDGTVIDYPVMFTPEDGEFYLYRGFNKEMHPQFQGCIFIDKHCKVEPRDTNLLIHGHNMDNGTMFHDLEKYEEESFYKEHPTFKYTTLYEEQEYEIVSVFLSEVFLKSQTDVFKFYQFYNAQNQEEFDYYINNCKALELYDTGISASYGDELITLSTCEYSRENGRLVIVARKK